MSTLTRVPAGVHFDDLAPADFAPPTGPDPLDSAEHAARNDTYHSPDAPAEPRMGLADWIETEAAYYRSLGSEAGDLAARLMADAAAEARANEARTPRQFLARREARERAAGRDGYAVQCPVCNSWM